MNINLNVFHKNISKWNYVVNNQDNTSQQNGIYSNNSRQARHLSHLSTNVIHINTPNKNKVQDPINRYRESIENKKIKQTNPLISEKLSVNLE